MTTTGRPRRAATNFRLGLFALVGLIVSSVVFVALVAWLNVRGEETVDVDGAASTSAPSRAVIEHGAYLARAGNCLGCHTTIGGAAFAGGRGVDTPFGVVVAPNITPDSKTGIGSWSAGEFWRAMHHGRSKDGRLLYPAFPYPSFTYVTRGDADALYAFLMAVPPVEKPNAPHALRFPYNTQAALAVWRALYFRPGELRAEAAHSAEWNRGRYLVQGLGHCAACHSGRNFLGGTSLNTEFAGGLMPDATWYAPSLASPAEAGVQRWARERVVKLLKAGVSGDAAVSGPMAEVVFASTQYLTDSDLHAMTDFLASIPVREEAPPDVQRADRDLLARGSKLYDQHCATCHGDKGQGVRDIYPALAGNRAVTLSTHHNVVQVVRQGGFMPTTAGNPRPFGMPPYGQVLSNDDIAAVTTFIRQSWGNSAAPVSALDVLRVK
ncbi:MAG TPA: c-type cytochrome [Rubrivivax sp.]|nr:c-type cytochrome [Rubrivivax sp.]